MCRRCPTKNVLKIGDLSSIKAGEKCETRQTSGRKRMDWHDFAAKPKRTPVVSPFDPLHRPKKNTDFEDEVKDRCIIPTKKDGLLVQSEGERLIADYLYDHDQDFFYDKLIKGLGGWARPDFRLKQKKIVIEYWGLKKGRADNPQYDEKAEKKIERYRLWDYKLIEVFNEHLPILDDYLREQLADALTFSDEYSSDDELRDGYEPDDDGD